MKNFLVLLGWGGEANVYDYNNTALKCFHKCEDKVPIKNNVAFLEMYQHLDITPKLIAYNIDEGWIQMENLAHDGFNPLTKYNLVRIKNRMDLLNTIVEARKKLPNDVYFTDLSKLDNIAYKYQNSRYVIKFYEAGIGVKMPNKIQRQLYSNVMKKKILLQKNETDRK